MGKSVQASLVDLTGARWARRGVARQRPFWTWVSELWIAALAVAWGGSFLWALAGNYDLSLQVPVDFAAWTVIASARALARRQRWRREFEEKEIPAYGKSFAEMNKRSSRFRQRIADNPRFWALLNWALALTTLTVWDLNQWWEEVPGLTIFGIVAILAFNGTRLWFRRTNVPRYLGSALMGLIALLVFLASMGAIIVPIGFAGLLANRFLLNDAFNPAHVVLASVGAGVLICRHPALEAWARRMVKPLLDRSVSLAQPSIQLSRRRDLRSPTLLLRSFKDDDLWLTADGTDESADRLEEVLARELADFGPFIAIGKPGELQLPGAARSHYKEDEWRNAVQAFIDEAAAIVAIMGTSSGFAWELDQVLTRGYANKLIVVLPPDLVSEPQRIGDDSDDPIVWLAMSCLRDAGKLNEEVSMQEEEEISLQLCLQGVLRGNIRTICFPKPRQANIIHSSRGTAAEYAAAIRLAVLDVITRPSQ